MSKPLQFLMIVQTMFLANAINQTLEPDEALKNRHEISASGAFIFMDDAMFASERIPEDMSASEAANEFYSFHKENNREGNHYWFLRSS